MANVYGSLVSMKSRRLRTVGLLMLGAVLLMAGYGVFSLMPALRAEKEAYRATHPWMGRQDHRREGRVLASQILFVTGYWAACGGLVIGLFGVAWLDAREVARNYALQRRQMIREDYGEGEKSGLS